MEVNQRKLKYRSWCYRVKNGKIIDTFKSFVECAFVPEYITKITGIKPLDL